MRGALVIRYGDPILAAAIEGGMRKAEAMNRQEIEAVRAEIQKMRQNQAALGVRVIRDARYYREKIAEAEENYGGIVPSTNPITNALWGIYGLIVEKVDEWLDYFNDQMAR